MEAIPHNNTGEVDTKAAVVVAGGEILQLADGRAAYRSGMKSADVGDDIHLQAEGQVRVAKTADIAMLAGGRAYWDRSASKAHFRPALGDFYLGVVVYDATEDDEEVIVDLNKLPRYEIELGKGRWTNGATDGLGVTATAVGGLELSLAFDNTAEVAMAAVYPTAARVNVADGPIFEGRIAIYDVGDDAALDINFGLANGTHATDADQITESVFFHVDGSALDVKAESDDGTTEVNATDTTVDAVDDTYAEYWIDARDPEDVKLYIDGVRVLDDKTFSLADATGPLMPLVHMEKTSNDTTAEVRVELLTVRTTDL